MGSSRFQMSCIALFGLSILLRFDLANSYDRISEVNKECAFVLKSASQLKPDLHTITEKLSFLNGDWWQDLGDAELMPFLDYDRDLLSTPAPLNLASFWVTDVVSPRSHHYGNSILVSGILQLGVTLEGGLLSDSPSEGGPRFDIWPGHSQLSIHFQGIYTESEKDHGERVMCLLGSTTLPSRQPESDNRWGWVKEFGYNNQPLLTQDDRILLILRYPQRMTLKSGGVIGSMKSLNPKSNLKYFDQLHLSSWFKGSENYQFTQEKDLVSKACDTYPFKDYFNDGEIEIYKGPDFCVMLKRLTRQEALTVLPNWKCEGPDEFCRKLGPFVLPHNKDVNETDGSFKNVKLVLQDVHCENSTSNDKKVFSVFRAVPPSEDLFTAVHRTGLSNMTLSAEGIWKPSSGQLCMVGCTEFACDTHICLYIPLSFSIKQRSVLLGTLLSINSSKNLFSPLMFEKLLVQPAELWDQYTSSRPYYKYSKIRAASVVLEKYEPFDFEAVVRKSLLKFPKIEDMENLAYSLSLLSEDLTLHVPAIPDPVPYSFTVKMSLELGIMSIGPLFGPYFPKQNVSASWQENHQFTEKQILLNVSGQLNTKYLSLFVEGVYDPRAGKMYLIGCRDVRADWKTLHESMDLESGLDCLIESVISYPPATARWLVDPTARISIASQRNEDDPLYFLPIKLQTVPIMYRKQRENILSRRGVEGTLRILALSIAIACISSQLFYMGNNLDSVPFLSFVMLGVQALGYILSLVSKLRENELRAWQWIHLIDYAMKFLVLVAFLLTLRIFQKVWKSRAGMLMWAPHEPQRVPSDKEVLLSTFIVHVLGYILVLVVHYFDTRYESFKTVYFVDFSGNPHAIREWETVLYSYLGLVGDFFLLPQVIANIMWEIQVKPLGKLYYLGMTFVRVFPHVYDYVGSPVLKNPYFSEEYEFVNPRTGFYSEFEDITITVIAVFLAVAVYVQQRWGYEKLGQVLALGRARFSPMGTKVYERLPFEAELASTSEKERDVE